MLRSSRVPRRLALAAAAALALACRERVRNESERRKIFVERDVHREPGKFDPGQPLEALGMSADEAAARAGAFAWQGQIAWSAVREGAAPVRITEQHRLRQMPSGDFEVSADLDPGSGPGAVGGKQIVYASGMTYARAKWAPFRERPGDRGEGARRYRDESFRLADDLAKLCGPALAAEKVGEGKALGRPAIRYRLSLTGEAPDVAPAPVQLPPGGYDADTKRRVDFLQGRAPTALDGELLLDAATGLPLSVTLRGAFSEKDDPRLRIDFDLTAQVTSLGKEVPPVAPPREVLADEGMPKGVARALEAAGLRHRAGTPAREDEQDDDPAASP
jgi:hypothetical protein